MSGSMRSSSLSGRSYSLEKLLYSGSDRDKKKVLGEKATVFSGSVAMRLCRVGVNFGALGLSDYWGL